MLALLDRVRPHLGQADCTLIADRGLAGFALVELCQARGWHYLLRLSKEHTCRRKLKGGWADWTAFRTVVKKPGYQWYGSAQVWQEQTIETAVSICWRPGCQEAWILISDRKAGKKQIKTYALRMRVEATFQDSKSRGWNIEASAVTEQDRLNRLLLGLFLALWWTSRLAAACIHHGQRARFDRRDRRDKGIFRLGRLWLLDMLRRITQSTVLVRCLPFSKQATGWRFTLRF